MNILQVKLKIILAITAVSLLWFSGCGNTDFMQSGSKTLIALPADEAVPDETGIVENLTDGEDDGKTVIYQELDEDHDPFGSSHLLFTGKPGIPITRASMGAVDPDPVTGNSPCDDYDGDGIRNELETLTNPYVADYPRIVTRVETPVSMEIRVDERNVDSNYVELIEDTDVRHTISDCMDSNQYMKLNHSTTPYITSDSWDENQSSEDYFEASDSSSSNSTYNLTLPTIRIPLGGGSKQGDSTSGAQDSGGQSNPGPSSKPDPQSPSKTIGVGYSEDESSNMSTANSSNTGIGRKFGSSSIFDSMSFDDVSYIDNMDNDSIEFTNDALKSISRNFKTDHRFESLKSAGPNSGVARVNLYIRNMSINMPVRITDVRCALLFKKHSGEFEPVDDFFLLNEDGSYFEEDLYGGQELGPFVIELKDLNTDLVRRALLKGYVPQIKVVSYKLLRVKDSIYGMNITGDNMKAIGETAKGRTATIKIVGKEMRELYRVAAFDVMKEDPGQDYDPDTDSTSTIIPGISLKKALFNILKKRNGFKEHWASPDAPLTVPDDELRWRTGEEYHPYTMSGDAVCDDNTGICYDAGNSWDRFETYLKCTRTDYDVKCIEAIKKIGEYSEYNPFNKNDNPHLDYNERMEDEEINSMKYWMILHNGELFKGDINDPIWVGDRYEIIFVEIEDFNDRVKEYRFSPLMLEDERVIDTRWNRLSNNGDFARALYLGRAVKGDVIRLEAGLKESRSLFGGIQAGNELGQSQEYTIEEQGVYSLNWSNFNYSFEQASSLPEGKPGDFHHSVRGGVNCIQVYIIKSENARYYMIDLQENIGGSEVYHIKVTPGDLKENGGFIYLNSNTSIFDLNGNVLGTLSGLSGIEYLVNVTAHGETLGIPVQEESGSGELIADVSQAAGPSLSFGFETASYNNGIELVINDDVSSGAEYYDVQVSGPYNYGNSDESGSLILPVQDITKSYRCRIGRNLIPVSTPELVKNIKYRDTEKDFMDPGVYRISVYGINEYTESTPSADNTPADNNDRTIHVPFERYGEQKVFKPALTTELLDPRAFDFEVNFNDGSGWFKLRLSYDDYSPEERYLDCRFTTQMKQKEQKLIIYFTPPSGAMTAYNGSQNSLYNVFRGGAEEADVFIRTSPRAEYRDTLWPKPGSGSAIYFMTDDSYMNYLPYFDILRYWIRDEHTDASNIEGLDRNVDALRASLPEYVSNDFGIKYSKRSDLFFSPALMRSYTIKAALSDIDISALLQDTTHADNLTYRALPGKGKISITNIDSQYATEFEIYIRQGEREPWAGSRDYEKYPWAKAAMVYTDWYYSPGFQEIHELVIPDDRGNCLDCDEGLVLEEGELYTVCVVALNSRDGSRSSGVYKSILTY